MLICSGEEGVLLWLVFEGDQFALEPEDYLLEHFGSVAHLLETGVSGYSDYPGSEELGEVGVLVLLFDVPGDEVTRGFESSLALRRDGLV